LFRQSDFNQLAFLATAGENLAVRLSAPDVALLCMRAFTTHSGEPGRQLVNSVFLHHVLSQRKTVPGAITELQHPVGQDWQALEEDG
jgi:hypothetical protein